MASIFINPFVDVGSGVKPADGAKLLFFATDVVTPKDTFTTEAASVAHSNPVIANAKGVFDEIWIEGSYVAVLKDKNDVQQWQSQPFASTISNSDLSITKSTIAAATADDDLVDFVGGYVRIAERTTGNPIDALYEVLANHGTEDGGGIWNSDTANLFHLKYIPQENEVYAAVWGVKTGTDVTLEAQAAYDYAIAQAEFVDRFELGGGTVDSALNMNSVPTIVWPSGKFEITATISTGNTITRGSLTYLFSEDRTITLMDCAGFDSTFQGMVFDGGAHHIVINGPRSEAMFTNIFQCSFRNAKKRCIKVDRTGFVNSGYPLKLNINNCRSYGSPFLESHTNGCSISDSWLAWDVSGTIHDGGHLIVASGPVDINNMIEVPFVSTASGGPSIGTYARFASPDGTETGSFPTRVDDILILRASNCRFGGEAIKVPLFELNFEGCDISFEHCDYFGTAGYWWGVVNKAYRKIRVDEGTAESWINTLGLFIHNSVDATTLLNNSILMLPKYTPRYNQLRQVFTGPDVTDLTIETTADWVMTDKEAPTVSLSIPNLLTNVIDSKYGAGWTNVNSGTIGASADNTDLGYPLNSYTADSLGQVGRRLTTPMSPTSAGTYTFSQWVIVNQATVITYKEDGKFIKYEELKVGINRTYCLYYYDGTNAIAPEWAILGSDGAIISIGMPMLSKGAVIPDWQAQGITTGSVPRITYTTGIPTAGSFTAGDMALNTAHTHDANNMLILGWSRRLTGSAHVPGTDWRTMYVSSVSPAN